MDYQTRLYLITPPSIPDVDVFDRQLMTALDAGDVACLQIRLKQADGVSPDEEAIRRVTSQILEKVQDRGVAVLVNDSASLAAELGADGVHIGQTDGTLKDARRWVGPDGIVGVTCHDSRHLAMLAGEHGADYVAFGAFFPTETKDVLYKADPELLTWWQEMMEPPCVAIGGITVENGEALVRAGADFLAVSGGVWSHPDGPAAAVKAFNEMFERVAGE